MFMYYWIICFLIDKRVHFIRQSFIEHFIVPFLIGCVKYYVHIHLLAFVLNIIPYHYVQPALSNCNTIKVCHAVYIDYWFGLVWNSLIVPALPLPWGLVFLTVFLYFFLGLLLFFSVAPNSCLKWSKMELHGWTRTRNKYWCVLLVHHLQIDD